MTDRKGDDHVATMRSHQIDREFDETRSMRGIGWILVDASRLATGGWSAPLAAQGVHGADACLLGHELSSGPAPPGDRQASSSAVRSHPTSGMLASSLCGCRPRLALAFDSLAPAPQDRPDLVENI